MSRASKLDPAQFGPVLAELGIDAGALEHLDPAPPPPSTGKTAPKVEPGPLLVGPIGGGMDLAAACRRLHARAGGALPEDAPALFFLKNLRSPAELVRWRNELWPWLHVVRIYRASGGAGSCETLQGTRALQGPVSFDGVVLVAHTRAHVLSPAFTVEKFDANASGWNGEPGRPGYAHFRWMRKYVALFGEPPRGGRILDFGCGAGWVGIEAALAAGGAALRSFDPSPEMVRLTGENARASGLADFEGRPGFGESPPFAEPFDYVVSSGVVSFAPDTEVWLDGLASTVRPGGELVIGDLNPGARGMRRRRARKVLLPAREMNGQAPEVIRSGLERRGFRHRRTGGYQLTWPLPELMHWSDARLGGALTPVLLSWNKLRAGGEKLLAFDSWVMRFTREA